MVARTNSDRNLLTGLLAWQSELVTEPQLLEAFKTWTFSKQTPVDEIFVAQGVLTRRQGQRLRSVVDAQVALFAGEGSAFRLTSVAPIAVRLGSEVGDADVQESVSRLSGSVAVETQQSGPRTKGEPDLSEFATIAVKAGSVQKHVGRFQIVRTHARGGLGEVQVAHDSELNRTVAPKEIRSERADDPELRSRFLREAEITAGLQHPGVVPVYAAGHYDDSRPYYAMRFIEGSSLTDAISDYHRAGTSDDLAFRELLGRFVDVCETIAYAHSRGVIHRDIKPSNIMVGAFGETLVVDWGLAKKRDESEDFKAADSGTTAHGIEPTVAGSVLGTVQYMSPEQAAGDVEAVGFATDVYSLGATLYQILANRAPFVGSGEEVLNKVRAGEFPSPRDENAGVSPALAAICLKAMSRRPEDRYASAADLGQDVKRWLADEATLAAPPTLPQRFGRAIRKRPAIATGVLTACGLIVAGLAGLNVLTSKQNRDLNAAQVAQEQATRFAKDEAARAGAVSDFLNDTLIQASPDEQPDRHIELYDVLERATHSLDTAFDGQPLSEAGVRQSLGVTYRALGEFGKAKEHLQTALSLLRGLQGTIPDEAHAALVDGITEELAQLAIQQGEWKRAEGLLLGLLDSDTSDEQDLTRRIGLAEAIAGQEGRLDEARTALERVLPKAKAKLGEQNGVTLAAQNNLAVILQQLGELDQSRQLSQQVLDQRRTRLGPLHPLTLDSLNNLAVVMEKQGDLNLAIEVHKECLAATHGLLGSKHPDYLTSENNLGTVRFRHARQLADDNKLQQATAVFNAARGNYQTAMLGRKGVLGEDHAFYEASLYNFARLQLETRQYESAATLYADILEADTRRRGREHRLTQATIAELAEALVGSRRYDEAIVLLDEAIKSCDQQRVWKLNRLQFLRGLCEFADSGDAPEKLDVAYTGLAEGAAGQPMHVLRSTKAHLQHLVNLTDAESDLRGKWSQRLEHFGETTEAPE